MLCLSRRVDRDSDEWIDAIVNYRHNPLLRSIIIELGGDPDLLLEDLSDTIKIKPLRIKRFVHSEEVVVGLDAPQHVEFIRSELR